MRTRLVARLTSIREEVEDMRSQHGELSREADNTRDRLGRELEDLQGQLEQLSVEKQNMAEKGAKLKSQVVSLTKDLELYQENQDQLEKKLKQEMKTKEEVTAKLSKREDKLRKKERQLEEEMTARERLEKEVSIAVLHVNSGQPHISGWGVRPSPALGTVPISYGQILWTGPRHWYCSRCLTNIH